MLLSRVMRKRERGGFPSKLSQAEGVRMYVPGSPVSTRARLRGPEASSSGKVAERLGVRLAVVLKSGPQTISAGTTCGLGRDAESQAPPLPIEWEYLGVGVGN